MVQLCSMSPYLAYGMTLYCIVSVYYLLKTMNIGTPFKDSLTPRQLQIKAASATVRRNIFLQGILVGILILIYLKPFQSC